MRLEDQEESLKRKIAMALSGCAALLFVLAPALFGSGGLKEPFFSGPSTEAFSAWSELKTLNASSGDELAEHFSRFDYDWPPVDVSVVPPLEVRTLPANLNDMVVDAKKSVFFRTLLPLVLAENSRIEDERLRLLELLDDITLDEGSAEWEEVKDIQKRYRVKGDPNDPAVRGKLLRRVDTVPVALVLAQAAKESGWGTSRFALQGNSLFGEWTWGGKGLAPSKRDDGKSHKVRAFPDIRASVRSYMRNLNTGFAYELFREMRADMRTSGVDLDPLVLAGGLERYSIRGEKYVREIRHMIRINGLERLTGLSLELAPPDGLPRA